MNGLPMGYPVSADSKKAVCQQMVDDQENEKFILILDVKDLMSSNLSWMSDF